MMCPSCGYHGKLEQLSFSSEAETYYCSVCRQKYVIYGESQELVPLPTYQKHVPHQPGHPHHS